MTQQNSRKISVDSFLPLHRAVAYFEVKFHFFSYIVSKITDTSQNVKTLMTQQNP